MEIGSSVASPYAALVLADMGTEVLKIERPVTGDISREWGRKYVEDKSAVFETMSRGKKSITVDMKDLGDVAPCAPSSSALLILFYKIRVPVRLQSLGLMPKH